MNKETIRKIGERMTSLINVVNLTRAGGSTANNPRQQELHGMYMLLKAAEIPFEIKYSDDAQDYLQIEEIIIKDQKFACTAQKN